jgi:hypothetical protein
MTFLQKKKISDLVIDKYREIAQGLNIPFHKPLVIGTSSTDNLIINIVNTTHDKSAMSLAIEFIDPEYARDLLNYGRPKVLPGLLLSLYVRGPIEEEQTIDDYILSNIHHIYELEIEQ